MAKASQPGAPSLALAIDRDRLHAALSAAAKIPEKKVTIPILGHVLLRAEAGTLSIICTNLDIEAAAGLEAEVEQAGAATVNAADLADLVKRMPEKGRVSMRQKAPGERLVVTSGDFKVQLATLNADDFPRISPDAGPSHRITLAAPILADLLKRGKSSISTEETRWYLNGTYCHVVEAEGQPVLRFVSTTGNQLAQLSTPRAQGLDPAMPGLIIPKRTVEAIEGLARSLPEATEVALEVSDKKIRVRLGEITITSKLIDHEYVDYQRVIPTRFAREAVVPTIEFIRAVERVAALSTEKSRGIRLSFGADTLTLSMMRLDDGSEASDQVTIDLTGEPLQIAFNAKLLAELAAQSGDDTTRLRLGAPAEPVVLTDKLGEGLFVLMPLRM